ncbi:hypothetical protein NW94_20245 [Burkholderia mallei]|nr:hypothetical protein DM57_09190 [Burkholderia mallei]ATD91403.1 hypothetical protein NM78_20905 [Burkholderia mallei]ATD95992.1 hypothetical protein NW91_19890 [Burkholderia mallei]ATE00848.1 hypothetical protein NW92_20500 [Burkholderia mallei]ATE05770.1 hypothetical protein NW93_20800 [Burkholderia mallei]
MRRRRVAARRPPIGHAGGRRASGAADPADSFDRRETFATSRSTSDERHPASGIRHPTDDGRRTTNRPYRL